MFFVYFIFLFIIFDLNHAERVGRRNTSNRNTNTNTNAYHELLAATLAQQERGGGSGVDDDAQLAARLQAEEYGGTTSEGMGVNRDTGNQSANRSSQSANQPSQSSNEQQNDCTICMSEISSDEQFKELPCKHKFHTACVDRWLAQNPSCPVCRTSVGGGGSGGGTSSAQNSSGGSSSTDNHISPVRGIPPHGYHQPHYQSGMDDFPVHIPPDNFQHSYGGIMSSIGQGLTNLGNWAFGGSNYDTEHSPLMRPYEMYGTAQPPPMRPYAMHGTAQPTPIPRGMLQPGRTISGINSRGNPGRATIISTNHYASPIEVTIRSQTGQQATLKILGYNQQSQEITVVNELGQMTRGIITGVN